MKNRFLKASLSVILAIVVIISSTISFGAAFSNETSDVFVLDQTITLENNEILFNSFNITENYDGSISLEATDDTEKIRFAGIECIDEPVKVNSTPTVSYIFYKELPGCSGGGHTFNFDNSAGVYRKVRVKLSRYNYFNEDGSHTTSEYTYHFGDVEYDGRDAYSSCLVIVSGAAINFVVPDKRGFVEFYTSTNINVGAGYYTQFKYQQYTDTHYTSGSGGGINGGIINSFTKGSTRESFVSIRDITEIQRYISKIVEFDKMKQYRADVDCNNSISILDATKIQLFLVNK